MQSIILAAGMGRRLGSLTENNTKCMIEVDGVPLIKRTLNQLDALGLDRIIMVVGYKKDPLIDYIQTLDIKTPILYVENPIYDKTNNIYSLFLARSYLLEDDTLLLESDLIFDDTILPLLLADKRPTLAVVDKYESWMDGTVVKIGEHDEITSFTPGKRMRYTDVDQYYKTVNIYKFSKEFSTTHYVPFLEAYSAAVGTNEYYEQVLRIVTTLDDSELKALRLHNQLWYEIDDIQDLDIAESMFADTDLRRLTLMETRFGGYWRYPHLIDFCYLVNTHYPPARMIDEMKASFETLLRQYPSGIRINSLLASKLFNVDQNHIVVGNGAAELIKSLMESFTGNIGVIRPTFEEYPNRYDADKTIVFVPEAQDYAYTADDVMAFYENEDLEALLLINPDNPSGNYIAFEDLHRLASWCEEKGIVFVLDESFADFADEDNNTFITDEILETYPRMVVMKSISKCYGVPGVRLGVLASSQEDLIEKMKADVSIWNINSFGEFYLQIAGKYQKDYRSSIEKFRETRRRFADELATVPGIRVAPSQANYFMIEVTHTIGARGLTLRLLSDYSLLIKGLVTKTDKEYIRVAIRGDEDNHKLVEAMKEILV